MRMDRILKGQIATRGCLSDTDGEARSGLRANLIRRSRSSGSLNESIQLTLLCSTFHFSCHYLEALFGTMPLSSVY